MRPLGEPSSYRPPRYQRESPSRLPPGVGPQLPDHLSHLKTVGLSPQMITRLLTLVCQVLFDPTQKRFRRYLHSVLDFFQKVVLAHRPRPVPLCVPLWQARCYSDGSREMLLLPMGRVFVRVYCKRDIVGLETLEQGVWDRKSLENISGVV